MIKIKLYSIFVDDQGKGLEFYTGVVGFEKKHDFPAGGARWITVTAPGRDDLELALEPNGNPAATAFQKSLMEQGIPCTAFEADDLDAEYARLTARGVAFTQKPTDVGPVKIAIFADTCGNLIQLYQTK